MCSISGVFQKNSNNTEVHNLSKKMNSFYAADLVNQYMTIICNRIVRYNKKIFPSLLKN